MHCSHRGKGEAILFIHGMPTNGMVWDGVIAQLSESFRCFAVDLPGMGETPFVPYQGDYLGQMAERIEMLRVRHGVRKWHVVGHDAGAAVAVMYAGHYAERVGCLALLSPAIFPDLKPFFLLNLLRKPVVGEVLAPLLHLAFWKIAMRRAIAGEGNRCLLRQFFAPFSGPKGAWRLMRMVRWGKPAEVLGAVPGMLAELMTPTLVLHGSRDVLPAAFAERAARLIPNASLVRLDAGHFISLDRPVDVAVQLRAFVARNGLTMDGSVPACKGAPGIQFCYSHPSQETRRIGHPDAC